MTPKLCPHHRAKFDSKKSVTFLKLPPGNWVVQLLIWIGNMWQLKAETIKTQVWSRIRWCLILPQPGSLVWFSLVWNIAYRLNCWKKKSKTEKRKRKSDFCVQHCLKSLHCKCNLQNVQVYHYFWSQKSSHRQHKSTKCCHLISNSLLTSPPYLSHELFSSQGHESE